MLTKLKNKIKFITLTILLLLCGCKKIEYSGTLGYEFYKISDNSITLKIYHVNKTNDCWEEIDSFNYKIKNGENNDLDLNVEGEIITINLITLKITNNPDNEQIERSSIPIASISIPNFKGNLKGFKRYKINKTNVEQLLLLYPISNNDYLSYNYDLSLNSPYNDEDNLDNILITIQFD